MSKPVISVESVSKLYRLGEISTGTISHDLNRWWHRVRGREDPYTKVGVTNNRSQASTNDWVWALKDISFQAQEGEAVGLIGRNGAGKSTLLKLLSRVTSPTQGRIRARGRISSLLEVGTGFHPELTGRENIYLNGAILGMRRGEIHRKLDEIVDFSGCAAYLDTPVKRYSSGMTVRLAFAVAAYLDAEILVIDEVLAVGDGEFQKKCLGKMNDAASSGRTLLFVSHNMGLISSLCQRVILLEEGQMVKDTTASEGVLAYYNRGKATPYHVDFTKLSRKVSGFHATLLEGRIEDENGVPVGEVDMQHSFQVRMRYRLEKDCNCSPYPNFHLTDAAGNPVCVTAPATTPTFRRAGEYESVCVIPGGLLNNGAYFFGLALTFMEKGVNIAFFEKDALCVNILERMDGTLDSSRHGYSGVIPGVIRPQFHWSVRPVS